MGGDRSSLKYFIETLGEIEGIKKYKERSEKLSKFMKGKPSPMKGKHHTDESKTKTKISVMCSEYHNSIRGKTFEEIYGEGSLQLHKNKMSGVFSLGWFIEKYGEQGIQKYDERSKSISKVSYFREYNKQNKNNYSKVSQELFWILYEKCKLQKYNVYFAELNHEFSCGVSRCNYDFVVKEKKKIIEFNGDMFHANPEIFSESDKPNPYTYETSADIWLSDELKIRKAKEKGYDVFVVWEQEYNKDREKIIEKCINFLKN